jgi:hypothetical protein
MTAAAIIVMSMTTVAMVIPQAAQAQQPFAITTHSSG